VIGTAAAPDFASYSLSYRRIDETTYKTILNSTTAVTNGALGKWDTTLLENDSYVLKLEVLDTFGSFSAVEVEVSVTGKGNDVSLVFERNLANRVTKVFDPVGNAVQYMYDSRGDLIKSVDREGHETKFKYRLDRQHYIDSVIDPLGREGNKVAYTSDGRLSSRRDANGNALRVSYDVKNSLVTTSDRLGN